MSSIEVFRGIPDVNLISFVKEKCFLHNSLLRNLGWRHEEQLEVCVDRAEKVVWIRKLRGEFHDGVFSLMRPEEGNFGVLRMLPEILDWIGVAEGRSYTASISNDMIKFSYERWK